MVGFIIFEWLKLKKIKLLLFLKMYFYKGIILSKCNFFVVFMNINIYFFVNRFLVVYVFIFIVL